MTAVGTGGPCASDHLLLRYLTTLEGSQLENVVYRSSAAALVVFRMLPSLAQQCVLRLVACERGPVPSAIWRLWMRGGAVNLDAFENALALLKRLHIVHVHGEWTLQLSNAFRASYFQGIVGGLFRAAGFDLAPDLEGDGSKGRKSLRDLARKSDERWECVLRYLALPSDDAMQGVSDATRQLFDAAGMTHGTGDVEITSSGFQFLLLGRAEQIWTYLIHFFEQQQRQDNNSPLPLLDFVLRLTLLSSSDYGSGGGTASAVQNAYVLDEGNWSEAVNAFLLHLRELGLVFIRKRKDGFFFTTPLLRLLSTTSNSALSISTDDASSLPSLDALDRPPLRDGIGGGFLIVETNFRVYAYTGSSLQLAILSTFCEMMYRFGDMAVGVLSRESVRRAMQEVIVDLNGQTEDSSLAEYCIRVGIAVSLIQVGITAAQIISYLRTNAHPETVKCPLPITVSDQIRLWEEERGRLQFNDATLYTTFESQAEYEALREFARSNKILLYNDDGQKVVVVTDAGHDVVKEWWKKKRF